MRRPVFVLAVVLTCASSAVSSAPARAEGASDAFLAQWKRVDELHARWDLTAAARVLTPLIPQAASLDAGYQRVWFDRSAAEVLSEVGRDDEARAFISDSERIVGHMIPCSDGSSGCQDTGYVAWRNPVATSRDVLTGAPEFDFAGNAVNPADLRREAVLVLVHYYVFVRRVPGGMGAIVSYFGPKLYRGGATKPPARLPYYILNFLPARFSGGPTGIVSGTSRYTVVIPSDEGIVHSRTIRPGGRVAVQAFATAGRKLIATWKPLHGGHPQRARYVVRDNLVTVRAPRRRGVYSLQLGVGTNRDFATGVSGVGVGVSPPAVPNAPSGTRGR